jgi:short-subunit dehydrogenase
MWDFSGKRAVITGAASGIGRAIAFELARAGCHCFLVDRDSSGLNDVVGQIRQFGVEAIGSVCDLSDLLQIDAMLDALLNQWPDVDILVNNAGVTFRGRTEQVSASEWQNVMAVNLIAPMQMTHRLLPRLLERPQAHVVNVCSLLGLCGFAKFSAYCASKFGLLGFSESLRAEYLGTQLAVHAICPGFVRTAFIESVPGPGGVIRERSTPRWLCTSAEAVADATMRAIRRNRRVVVLTPFAQLVWRIKRYTPFVLEMPLMRRKRRVETRMAVQDKECKIEA